MLIVALLVNGMAARHENNRLRGGEEIIATNGTVAFRVAFNTSMRALEGDGHTDVARLPLD